MTKFYSREEDRHHRSFPMVPLKDEAGKQFKAYRITCVDCGAEEHRKRSNDFADDWFRRKGWDVGNNAGNDRCPACIEIKRRVIKMSDHKPAAEQPQPTAQRAMTRDDGRILSRLIEDHWDEVNACYRMGWSDLKLAEANGVPVDWVKEIRERDFGGTGEDPTLTAFIAAQIEVKREMALLTSALEMNRKKLEESTMWNTELTRKLDGYRNTTRRLIERVEALEKIADSIDPQAARKAC